MKTKNKLLKILLEVIREYRICNIFDLYDFIDENGESYGLNINSVNEVIAGKLGL